MGRYRRFVLASRSPQRLQLLTTIFPPAQIDVIPPQDATEKDLSPLRTLPALSRALEEIACAKRDDTWRQLSDDQRTVCAVIAADTTIAVERDDGWHSLGKPSEDELRWREEVRDWFRKDYAGKTHLVLSAIAIILPGGLQPAVRVVQSKVTFHDDIERWLNLYIMTGEPRGKAGGYAIQGAGSVFVSRVEGSLSNIIGLPLETLMELLSV